MIDCKRIQLNCTSYPTYLPEPVDCCKTPELVSNELHWKCYLNYSRNEFFSDLQRICIHISSKADSLGDKKFDFDAAKTRFLANTNNTKLWEKPISDAVDASAEKIKGCAILVADFYKFLFPFSALQLDKPVMDNTETLSWLLHFFRGQMNVHCVEFPDELCCKKVAIFVKACPSTKPPIQPGY